MFHSGGTCAPFVPGTSETFQPEDDTPLEWRLVLVCRRLRVSGARSWFEFLGSKLRRMGEAPQYTFFEAPIKETDSDEVLHAIAAQTLQHCAAREFRSEVAVEQLRAARDTTLRVKECGIVIMLYSLPTELTRLHRRGVILQYTPSTWWLVESELFTHRDIGAPSAFGACVAELVCFVMSKLPIEARMASAAPPLVLYHGTGAGAAESIARAGLLTTTAPAMLGHGLYFARWSKAARFAKAFGVVCRCLVFSDAMTTMTAQYCCDCGCGRQGVDHNGALHRSTAADTVFLPDNSYGASEAEWCVYEPKGRVLLQAMVRVK